MASKAANIYFCLLFISLSWCKGEDINHTDQEKNCAVDDDCSLSAVQITPTSYSNVQEPSQDSHTLNYPVASNQFCPSNVECHMLPIECITCRLNLSCVYGQSVNVSCFSNTGVTCQGRNNFERTMICQYCYQTLPSEHSCKTGGHCSSSQKYVANCTAHSNVLCLGRRTFLKNIRCNWTSGYRWITALLLSITLGGFGADRFYLGHWQEGIGKLFSFGGLGVWTIVDVILVAVGYLRPADGSLYI